MNVHFPLCSPVLDILIFSIILLSLPDSQRTKISHCWFLFIYLFIYFWVCFVFAFLWLFDQRFFHISTVLFLLWIVCSCFLQIFLSEHSFTFYSFIRTLYIPTVWHKYFPLFQFFTMFYEACCWGTVIVIKKNHYVALTMSQALF